MKIFLGVDSCKAPFLKSFGNNLSNDTGDH